MAALELDEPEIVSEGESAPEIRQDSSLELGESDDQPGEEFYPPEQESPEPTVTAGMAASNEHHTPAEAAPAAPPATEQAETENFPHE